MKQIRQHTVCIHVAYTRRENILGLQTSRFLVSTLLLLLVSNATSALCLIHSHLNEALHHSDMWASTTVLMEYAQAPCIMTWHGHRILCNIRMAKHMAGNVCADMQLLCKVNIKIQFPGLVMWWSRQYAPQCFWLGSLNWLSTDSRYTCTCCQHGL